MSPENVPRDDRFTTWLEEHRGIFLKIARAYAAASLDQADLLQEMQLQVWRSLASFRGQARPSTWIYRVCLNTALTWRRDEQQHRSRVQTNEQLPEFPSNESRPGWSHEEAELLGQLYAAIRQLALAERSLVLLALDGLSYREMAEVTGLTENHVGVALTRARDKLAARLKGIRDELE
jgi:RNA polymerase sigma-70 factor (ECF subfamily)